VPRIPDIPADAVSLFGYVFVASSSVASDFHRLRSCFFLWLPALLHSSEDASSSSSRGSSSLPPCIPRSKSTSEQGHVILEALDYVISYVQSAFPGESACGIDEEVEWSDETHSELIRFCNRLVLNVRLRLAKVFNHTASISEHDIFLVHFYFQMSWRLLVIMSKLTQNRRRNLSHLNVIVEPGELGLKEQYVYLLISDLFATTSAFIEAKRTDCKCLDKLWQRLFLAVTESKNSFDNESKDFWTLLTKFVLRMNETKGGCHD
jgi:hypothetical protein